MLAISALMVLLMVGVTHLPPADLGIADTLQGLCSPLLPGQQGSNELHAGTSLKTLASAQADFRANDRDRDGINQFWRGDVAGLYALSPGGGPAIKLIQLEVAASDDRPMIQRLPKAPWRPFHGYRIRAIRHADENPKALDPNRFAFVAYPVSPSAGKRTIIIDENNSLFSSYECPPGGLFVFPTDAERRSKWSHYG